MVRYVDVKLSSLRQSKYHNASLKSNSKARNRVQSYCCTSVVQRYDFDHVLRAFCPLPPSPETYRFFTLILIYKAAEQIPIQNTFFYKYLTYYINLNTRHTKARHIHKHKYTFATPIICILSRTPSASVQPNTLYAAYCIIA